MSLKIFLKNLFKIQFLYSLLKLPTMIKRKIFQYLTVKEDETRRYFSIVLFALNGDTKQHLVKLILKVTMKDK